MLSNSLNFGLLEQRMKRENREKRRKKREYREKESKRERRIRLSVRMLSKSLNGFVLCLKRRREKRNGKR